MATKAKMAKNERRRVIAERYREQRAELKAMTRDMRLSQDQRQEAAIALSLLPRDASPTRIRNRCIMTGRPRGYYRKFGLSRIALRDAALRGDLPGVRKSSW
ncbi:MAG: 30S ribosomal protein S14 [Thermoanaerobaculia bacterium]|nr:30S ribosomal protein S14 [Thermoanaerobaculia bacterium]